MASSDKSDPPPPYPGYSNPGDIRGPQPGYPSAGYPGGNFPAGYSQPGVPGGGYSQSYGTQPGGFSQSYSHAAGGQAQFTHSNVVVSQPLVTLVQTYRESPVRTTCPHCQAEVVTGTHFETGTATWLVCCILFAMGCVLGCCLIPFCVDGCKDVIHTCPNCHQQIARYSRM